MPQYIPIFSYGLAAIIVVIGLAQKGPWGRALSGLLLGLCLITAGVALLLPLPASAGMFLLAFGPAAPVVLIASVVPVGGPLVWGSLGAGAVGALIAFVVLRNHAFLAGLALPLVAGALTLGAAEAIFPALLHIDAAQKFKDGYEITHRSSAVQALATASKPPGERRIPYATLSAPEGPHHWSFRAGEWERTIDDDTRLGRIG